MKLKLKNSFNDYIYGTSNNTIKIYSDPNDKSITFFKDSILAQNEEYFKRDIALGSILYKNYKSVLNIKNSIAVHVEIKKIETKHYGHLYHENKTFSSFFKWRIKQFLDLFSRYGKEPERAIFFHCILF
jgi:hypothetical protein